MNPDISKLNRAELEEEYQLSQWALSWALHKLGGSFTITRAEMEEQASSGRVWYSTSVDGDTTVQYKKLEQVSPIL